MARWAAATPSTASSPVQRLNEGAPTASTTASTAGIRLCMSDTDLAFFIQLRILTFIFLSRISHGPTKLKIFFPNLCIIK